MRGKTVGAITELDDGELIVRCIAGEQLAWQTLVERYQRLVYSVALRSGLSHDDADDVFQIVFTTLFRRLDGLRDQRRIASWLITTTSREAWRLAKSRTGQAELDEELAGTDAPPAQIVEDAERDQRVRDALACLDDRCRELLTALFLESGTPGYAALAARLGMPVGSIGPTRARCFKKLEAILIEEGLR